MSGMLKRLLAASAMSLLLLGVGAAARADNQTPTTSPITVGGQSLPFKLELKRVQTNGRLPTLQSFAAGNYGSLWVLIGGRTNGLHDFSSDPLQNFPPSEQNRRIWVVDSKSWRVWSREITGSGLSTAQVDQMSATNYQAVQQGNTLYVIGGYGYSRGQKDFVTFPVMTAYDLPAIVDWVRNPGGGKKLSQIIRQDSNGNFRITGGEAFTLDGRVQLSLGHDFDGGYFGPDTVQTYSGQVRSFEIVDKAGKLDIKNVRHQPHDPTIADFKRRDFTMVPFIDNGVDKAAVLGGVFTATDGGFTVPIEVTSTNFPYQVSPTSPNAFKQGMNGYSCASITIWDAATGANHILLFGGISYVTYDTTTRKFVEDPDLPFTSQVTAITRSRDDRYKQYLLLETPYPKVSGPDVDAYLFGANAKVFLAEGTPVQDNGVIDLAALRRKPGTSQVIGWIFGGIAAEQPNFGKSVVSNEVFAITLTER